MRRLVLALLLISSVQILAMSSAEAAKPSIKVRNAARYEPRKGEGAMTFAVKLSAPSRRQIRVNWVTSDGTAIAGEDYTASSGTVVFKPGITRQRILVPTLADGIDEPDETFTVTLSEPKRAVIKRATATGTIWDADAPPSVSIGNVSALEGDSGSQDVTMSITLSAPSSLAVDVTLTSVGVTATQGVDFDPLSDGVFTFSPGQTSKVAHFTIYGDTDVEPDETWESTLSSPVNAALGDPSGFGLIVNDD